MFVCLLHLTLGFNGLVGGILLMLRTDGSLLGMQPDLLIDSPFRNYLVPGILLSLFIGVIPLVTFTGLIIKIKWKVVKMLNVYRTMHWAWTFSLYTGIISIFWITVQLIMTQYFWIQPVIIFIGLFIIIITMIPAVMKHYETGK